jgi:hypothetical protein
LNRYEKVCKDNEAFFEELNKGTMTPFQMKLNNLANKYDLFKFKSSLFIIKLFNPILKKLNIISGLQCEGFEGPCTSQNAKRYHMNTQYVEVEKNYATHCDFCKKGSEDYWEERWNEYYSERL